MVEESEWHSPYEHFFSKDIYIYNNKGLKVEKKSYSYDNSLFTTTTYLYNKKGDLKEIKTLTDSGNLFCKIYKYKYDNQGNWIEKREYEENRLVNKIKRKYQY